MTTFGQKYMKRYRSLLGDEWDLVLDITARPSRTWQLQLWVNGDRVQCHDIYVGGRGVMCPIASAASTRAWGSTDMPQLADVLC